MAFTYDLSSSNAAVLRISKVRLTIPDNDSANYELQDDEISYFLDQTANNINGAAALACSHLARKYSKMVGFTADGSTVRYGERAKMFSERAKELSLEAQGYVGSVTLNRADGYEDVAVSSDYSSSRTVYIRV